MIDNILHDIFYYGLLFGLLGSSVSFVIGYFIGSALSTFNKLSK